MKSFGQHQAAFSIAATDVMTKPLKIPKQRATVNIRAPSSLMHFYYVRIGSARRVSLRLVLLRRSMPPFTWEARPGWGPTEEARCCRFYPHCIPISNQARLMAFSQSSYISPQQSVATSAFIPVLQETVFPSPNHKTKTTNEKWKTIENMHTHNHINSSK